MRAERLALQSFKEWQFGRRGIEGWNAADTLLKDGPWYRRHTEILLQKLIRKRSPLKVPFRRLVKRATDIGISAAMTALIFPLLVPLLAILIKIDSPGPVFFIQRRHKKNGRIFGCLKFRTMRVNDEADTRPTMEDDNRITRVGKYLRRYHIDELPQLINVLVGDMSLVGPRPHMVAENLRFENKINEWNFRNEVQPGITGLSQSFGNFGATDDLLQVEERLLFDLLYIKHWSIQMEIKIVLRTIRRMVSR